MEFTELLRGLGEKLGIELAADENGSCVMSVDETMQVTLQSLDEVGAVGIWGVIGEPPPQGLEALLSAMLNANHLFHGTGGATISRDPDTGSFFLCRCDPLSLLDVESFSDKLEKFVNTLEAWQELVVNYRPDMAGASKPADDADMPAFGAGPFIAV